MTYENDEDEEIEIPENCIEEPSEEEEEKW